MKAPIFMSVVMQYMAKDVDSCLHEIIEEHGKVNSNHTSKK